MDGYRGVGLEGSSGLPAKPGDADRSRPFRQANQPGHRHVYAADKCQDGGDQDLQIEQWARLLHVEQIVFDPLMEIA